MFWGSTKLHLFNREPSFYIICFKLICRLPRPVTPLTVTVVFIQQGFGSIIPAHSQSSPCSIRTSDGVSGLDFVSVVVSTPGQGCNFTLSSSDTGGEGSECRKEEKERGEEGREEVFTCMLDELEAGTSYPLLISSQTDQEEANITLHTSKSTSTSLQHQSRPVGTVEGQ